MVFCSICSPQSKDAESADDKRHVQKQKGLVMSLLSPQGIHPTPTSSLRDSPITRKCSLIKEESVDEDREDDDDDLEIETCTDKIRASKSAENLDVDENHSSHTSPIRELDDNKVFMKRPLLSVASSPQLLNQICEENESDEDDDFVPPRLDAARMLTQRNSVASPEVIRKYEARRKHHRGTGSRGTSCSSSDASDTDDTEGRSRKDKLKHKFIHRRDSSDHSSDTDGGPSGHGGGGFGRGLGGGGTGGNGPSRDDHDRGGGGGKKDGKGGSPKNGRHHHSRGKHNNLGFKLNNESLSKNGSAQTCDSAMKGSLSSMSVASVSSRSSLKYVIERDENVSDSDAEDNDENDSEVNVYEMKKLKECLLERLSQECKNKNLSNGKHLHSDFSSIDGKAVGDLNKLFLAQCSPGCDMIGQHKQGHSLAVKMDINSNMFCKQNCQVDPIKIETKCCSLV